MHESKAESQVNSHKVSLLRPRDGQSMVDKPAERDNSCVEKERKTLERHQ